MFLNNSSIKNSRESHITKPILEKTTTNYKNAFMEMVDEICYDSGIKTITLIHTKRSRLGIYAEKIRNDEDNEILYNNRKPLCQLDKKEKTFLRSLLEDWIRSVLPISQRKFITVSTNDYRKESNRYINKN